MIAFFGMGLLGSNFVRALRRRGEGVHVWNRSPDKATTLDPGYFMAEIDSADPCTHYMMGHIPPPEGGLDDTQALAKLEAGAELVQIYSGLIFRGPDLVAECVRATAAFDRSKETPP